MRNLKLHHSIHKALRTMGKLQISIAIVIREGNIGKSPNSSKQLSLVDEDLKSTLNALATEIKKKLTSKIKQSVREQFNELKEVFQKMR